MKINAIPTEYAGVRFRSRLEAKWAAFFDLIGWKWEYEPLDLAGYIPDFIVDSDYLIEVKPIIKWPCAVLGCIACNDTPREEYDTAVTKILKSGWSGKHALIVGAAPFKGKLDVGPLLVDALGRVVSSDLWMIGMAFDFMRTDLVGEWREAGNRVQWRSPRASHVIQRHVAIDPVGPIDEVAARYHKRREDEDLYLEIANGRSVQAESPGGFCWICGYPTGFEAPGELDHEYDGDGIEVRHVNRAQCERNRCGEMQ